MFSLRFRDFVFNVAGAFKALAALLFTVALAVADWYDVVPLRPVLEQLFGGDVAAKVAIYVPLVFGTLRYISTTQLKHHRDEGF
jgi:hypothetical protein